MRFLTRSQMLRLRLGEMFGTGADRTNVEVLTEVNLRGGSIDLNFINHVIRSGEVPDPPAKVGGKLVWKSHAVDWLASHAEELGRWSDEFRACVLFKVEYLDFCEKRMQAVEQLKAEFGDGVYHPNPTRDYSYWFDVTFPAWGLRSHSVEFRLSDKLRNALQDEKREAAQ